MIERLAWVLLPVGLFVIVFNIGSIVVNMRYQRRGVDRHVSMVPIVGPALASVATALAQQRATLWIVLPWIVDPGSWAVVAAIIYGLRTE